MLAISTRFLLCLLVALLLVLPNGSGQAQERTEALIQKLSDPDPTVRGETMRKLETMPTALVVPGALEALKTADKDSAERLVKVLVHHPDSVEIDPLITLAKKYDGLGSEVFAVLGADGARGLGSAAVKNCDAKVGEKEFLVWAGETASHGGPEARAVLKEQTSAGQPCVRRAALYGLAAIYRETDATPGELEEAAEMVVARLADCDSQVVATAKLLLKPDENGGRRYNQTIEDFSPERLMKFFNTQKDPEVRVRVSTVLAAFGDPSIQEFMNHLADDPDAAIREIAKNYVPPQYEEEDRIHYSESPQSGITAPEKAAEIDGLRKSRNPLDRVSAAERMAKSGDVLYTTDLIQLLKDPSMRVRAKAAEGLGELNEYFEDAAIRWMGNREDSAPALYAALDDRSAKVRAAAAKSLASLFPEHPSSDEIPLDHEQVLEKLKALSHDANPAVAKQASLAYARFLQPDDVKFAINLLQNGDPHIRLAAAGAVADSRSPLGVKPLLALLKDPDKSVRCDVGRLLWIMVILGKDEDRAALSAELTTQLLADALQDPVITKSQILDLLAASGDPNATQLFLDEVTKSSGYSPEGAIRMIANSKRPDAPQILLKILRSGNFYGGYECLQALMAMKDPSVVEPILSFARTPQGAWINQEQVLLAFRDGRLVQALLDHLKDKDEATRAAAARDLKQYRDERIVPALIAALKDEAWTAQYAAAASLGQLGDPRATSALVAMLDYNPGAAALALGDLHRVETVPQLSALLASPKASNRKEIVAGIAKMPEPVAARAFASFIEKSPVRDCDLDNDVAQALAKLNDPGVIPALQKINLDGWKKNGCVLARVTAAAALSQRGARAFPEGKENSVVP